MTTIRAAAVQFEHASGDKRANLAKIRSFVAQAANQEVQIIAFPECCITGYWFLRHLSRDQFAELAEPVPDGSSTRAIVQLAAQHRMTIGAGLIEVADGCFYNTYVVATPDGQVHRHRKIHAFVSQHLSCGSEYTVFDTPHGCRLGVLICYDNNLVENARITALMGADILLAPHQTGGCDSRSPHAMKPIDPALWENRKSNPTAIREAILGTSGRGWLMRWLPSRAHDNGMFVVFSNGVGRDDNEVRTGNAMILDPYGRTLVETSEAADAMVVADLDLSLRDWATGSRWIKARRPDLYAPLAQASGNERDTRTVRFEEPPK